jgi:hypothetical protein
MDASRRENASDSVGVRARCALLVLKHAVCQFAAIPPS